MPTKIDHIHFAVSDLQKSEEFYCRYFGAHLIARYSWRDVRTVAVRIGDTRVNLTRGISGPTVNHLGFAVPDLELDYARMARDGVAVKSGPHTWGPDQIHQAEEGLSLTARFAFVSGPDGEVVELVDRGHD